ncbi:23S rRNA (pseudouridine(1915)-N(3))-methyltransferase RlmH [Candidatus Saccharibacteria bacterium]|nr:23S rRNA (pseudouridine(1915)-N(3))-methyltransferase RlmH [Candidatus Saccharibacteria bacterium]
MKIIAIGKKHEKWVMSGIELFEKRLKKPFDLKWDILPHSNFAEEKAREEETQRILAKIKPSDFVILLDERGKNISSPELSKILMNGFVNSQNFVIVIGGAFGVADELRQRANFVWSLSKLVFPHQIVRLILVEQIYRAQEISSGGKYHHE